MIKLYQRWECSHCDRVRDTLASLGIPYETIEVPRLPSERTALAQYGLDSNSVPVLVDGEHVLQDTEEIIEHLRSKRSSWYGEPRYGMTKTLRGVSYADAIPLVKEALAGQGFGVLTEIDVAATLKKKLDVDFRPYIILGACNPPLAHMALTGEPAVGLLLPCNVVVSADDEGNAVVSAIDPKKMLQVVDNPDVDPIADQVKDKFKAVFAAL